jgi:hypothetical protein
LDCRLYPSPLGWKRYLPKGDENILRLSFAKEPALRDYTFHHFRAESRFQAFLLSMEAKTELSIQQIVAPHASFCELTELQQLHDIPAVRREVQACGQPWP